MSFKGMKLKAQHIKCEVEQIESFIERKERGLSLIDRLIPEIYENFEVYEDVTIRLKSKEDLTKVRRLLKESFGSWSDEFGTLSHFYGEQMIASWHGKDPLRDVRIVFVEKVDEIDLEWYGLNGCRIKKHPKVPYRDLYEVSCEVEPAEEETGVRAADED